MAELAPLVLWNASEPDWASLSSWRLDVMARRDIASTLVRFSARTQRPQGVELPGPCQTIERGSALIVWQGPGEWLALHPLIAGGPWQADTWSETTVWSGDVTHRLVILDLGIGSREMISHGCPIDAATLAPGSCASTRFAGLHTTLVPLESGRLRLITDRSHEPFLFDWFKRTLLNLDD